MGDEDEKALRMEWLRMQLRKAEFDIDMEKRKLTRQTIGIALSVAGIVIGAFAAGAAWMHYFTP